jgi:hypothetical protein
MTVSREVRLYITGVFTGFFVSMIGLAIAWAVTS